jgi:hypothetical protein
MIKLESDVRDMVRKMVGPARLMTVESAKGGTDGYPDFTIMYREHFYLCELKRGELMIDTRPTILGLRVHLRPGQKQVIRQCAAQRIHVHVIGGEIGTTKLWYSRGVDCISDSTGITVLRTRFNTLGMLESFFDAPFDPDAAIKAKINAAVQAGELHE